MNKNIIKQKGAVSLFIVIFAALLITVITVGFIRIMIQNQQQATANDLSQSAYDSAQAGVEDAKRAILMLQSICASNPGSNDCKDAAKKYTSTSTCNEAVLQLSDVLTNMKDNEVKVQTEGKSNALNQAYTCVKIVMNTDDYVGKLVTDSSKLIPLVGVNDFDTIKVEWFNANDLKGESTTINGLESYGAASPPLLSQSSWNEPSKPNRPSIMRAQLIQFDNTGFSLDDFNKDGDSASNNTLFLYPSGLPVGASTFSGNVRPPTGAPAAPSPEHCEPNIASGGYACTATLKLPKKVSISDNSSSHTTYLNLKSFYKSTNYKVTLYNSTVPVQFNGVEPMVDSTGRADNLFRRVQTRVEFSTPLQPEIYTAGNFCKVFFVANLPRDYNPNTTLCTP